MNYWLTWFTVRPPMLTDFSKQWEAQYPLLAPDFDCDLWVVIMKGC